MRCTWVNKRGLLRIQLSVIIYTIIFTLTQTLRGFPFFIDDLIKRFIFDSASFFIAFTVTYQFKDWLNKNYDWNVNPKKRLIIESILRVLVSGGIIILLHIVLSYIFIVLTLNVTSNPYSDKFSEVLIYYFFGNYTYVGFFDVFIKFLVLVLVIELFVIFDFSSYLIQKWNSSKIEKEAFEKEKAQYSLELLRTQINPHFLFNNLNTLSSLIYINQDKAADFLRKLSGVYRNILEYRNKETILLSEELSFFNTYADLLQVRFMDMLFFNVQVEETLLNKKIIPLTLQMLVENAIKHNVISSNRPLYIIIKTENDMLTVSNNLQMKETREYSSGLGLTMISNRYDYISDRKIVINKTDELFVISVPLID